MGNLRATFFVWEMLEVFFASEGGLYNRSNLFAMLREGAAQAAVVQGSMRAGQKSKEKRSLVRNCPLGWPAGEWGLGLPARNNKQKIGKCIQNLVNLFLTNLVRISGFSSLFLAIAVLSALFAREW